MSLPDPRFLSHLAFHSALLLTLVVSLIVLGLVLLKLSRIAARRHEGRLRSELTPLVEACLADSSPGLPARLQGARGRDRRVLQYCLVRRSFGTSGALHARIAGAYERLGFVDSDLKNLKNPLWWVRAEAGRCLGQMRCARAKPALLSALKDRVLEVRLMSAWSLGRIGDPAVVTPVLESLAHGSRLAGLRLSSTVFELGAKAVEPLLSVADHADPAVRALVLHLLGELRCLEALPKIIERLDPREDHGVRVAACKALGALGDRGAAPALASALEEEAWELRAQAAQALGRLKAESAVGELSRAMADGHWQVRRNAGEALARMGGRGHEALRRVHRDSPDRFAREMAAQWLDDLGIL